MGRASDPLERREDAKHLASIRAAESVLKKVAVRVEQIDRWIDDPGDSETFITQISFKVGGGWDDGTLVIVKARRGREKVVAFHGDDSFLEALTGLGSRLANGTLKWKVDEPYDPKNGK